MSLARSRSCMVSQFTVHNTEVTVYRGRDNINSSFSVNCP